MASSSNPLTGLDIPIAEPPPGYSQVLTNPPSQGYILIIISSIFLTLMVCSFLIRVYTKICISKEWGLDDCKYPDMTLEILQLTFARFQYTRFGRAPLCQCVGTKKC